MQFKKPPVVESWISFDFDPNENKRGWDMELVTRYAQQIRLYSPKARSGT